MIGKVLQKVGRALSNSSSGTRRSSGTRTTRRGGRGKKGLLKRLLG
jgi:hypothetical protein